MRLRQFEELDFPSVGTQMRLMGRKLRMSKQKYPKGTNKEKRKERRKNHRNSLLSTLLSACSLFIIGSHGLIFPLGGPHLVMQVALSTCAAVLVCLQLP